MASSRLIAREIEGRSEALALLLQQTKSRISPERCRVYAHKRGVAPMGSASTCHRQRQFPARGTGLVTRSRIMGGSNDQTAICLAGDSRVWLGAVAVSALHAQSNAPYYQVAGIAIDQAGYEASGVDKVRDAIKAAGGKVIAGGYNKAVAVDSDISAPNRFLIFLYPSKEVADKVQNDTIKPWAEKVKGKYVDRYRVFGVEAGAEQK